MDGAKGASLWRRSSDAFGRVLGEDAGELVVKAGAADGIEVAQVAVEPRKRLGFRLEA